MKFKEQPLQTFRLRNFKAVRDSGVIKFTPLTVFIGNNGSGKSSLIEGLETFQSIVVDGLDEAMNRWRGFEFLWNKTLATQRLAIEQSRKGNSLTADEVWEKNPLEFRLKTRGFYAEMDVASSFSGKDVLIAYERYFQKLGRVKVTAGKGVERSDSELVRDPKGFGGYVNSDEDEIFTRKYHLGESMFSRYGEEAITSWQFLNLSPEAMSAPRFTTRTGSNLRLHKDGGNIADYLNDILENDREIFDGIVETLRYVLPYAIDIQSVLTSELGRQLTCSPKSMPE